MKLPEFFEKYFLDLMGHDEYSAFKRSFDQKRYFGIRINSLKISPEEFTHFLGKTLERIPWVDEGFYYENESFGKHPAYHAGLYYIQEPSAMMPAQALSAKPGEKVLDLCAAPGGKTTHLGVSMKNQGFLLSNDISPKRVKALVKNIELTGLTNSFVTNESPDKLKEIYPEFFDRILLDVPCSGEGMFRKDREAIQSYTRFKAEECVTLQRQIMDSAYEMLKPGGTMVYSTCTFNPDENERNIEYFISKYDLEIDKLEPVGGFEPSRSDWTQSGNRRLSGGLRLWPYKAKGEGHFVCCLKKAGKKPENEKVSKETSFTSKEAEQAYKVFMEFKSENLKEFEGGMYHIRGTSLFRLPQYMSHIPPVQWEKVGLYVGEYAKGRFEPSQSVVMSLKPENFNRVIRFNKDDTNIIRYLKGETLFVEGENGYNAVCMEDYPLGWAKLNDGTLKNLYPRGWRMM